MATRARRCRSSSRAPSSPASGWSSRTGARSRSTPTREADALRAAASSDEGASRLGEIALVDGLGRIGPLETTFFDTLIDENAASHIALGNGYDHPVEDEREKARINQSRVHIDFMIGSPELDIDGVTRDGDVVPRSPQRELADLGVGETMFPLTNPFLRSAWNSRLWPPSRQSRPPAVVGAA